MRKIGLVVIVIGLLASSCTRRLNPSIMFKTADDYQFDQLPDSVDYEYKIAANDVLSFRLFTNNGFRLIDVTNENMQQMQQLNIGINYIVEYDGIINLPIIGRVNVAGKTLREAELFLEELYEEVYIDPFIMLNISNRRAIVFPGDGGSGVVIPLENNNVTLLEALAQAGGISDDGKAYKVKLIRNFLNEPTVYLIDLSTIDGVKKSSMILQANDVIYVEPIGITLRQVAAEFSPLLSFVTSIITLYIVVVTLD